MNRRTNKLMDHVANAMLASGHKPELPRWASKRTANTSFNPAKNLKRKLKREWNLKPRNTRNDQRMGIIRTLVALHEGAQRG